MLLLSYLWLCFWVMVFKYHLSFEIKILLTTSKIIYKYFHQELVKGKWVRHLGSKVPDLRFGLNPIVILLAALTDHFPLRGNVLYRENTDKRPIAFIKKIPQVNDRLNKLINFKKKLYINKNKQHCSNRCTNNFLHLHLLAERGKTFRVWMRTVGLVINSLFTRLNVTHGYRSRQGKVETALPETLFHFLTVPFYRWSYLFSYAEVCCGHLFFFFFKELFCT